MDKVRCLPEGTGFGATILMPRHSALIPFCTHLLEAMVPLLFHCTALHMAQAAPSPGEQGYRGTHTARAEQGPWALVLPLIPHNHSAQCCSEKLLLI